MKTEAQIRKFIELHEQAGALPCEREERTGVPCSSCHHNRCETKVGAAILKWVLDEEDGRMAKVEENMASAVAKAAK